MTSSTRKHLRLGLLVVIAAVYRPAKNTMAADGFTPFEGERTSWHEAFDRYDLMMDDATGAITPMKAPEKEVTSFGIDDTLANGKRRCVVIVPKKAAPGYPWSWRGCYWDHQPQTEIQLLKRGFHVAYIEASATLRPGREWDAWYAFLTREHGLSGRPAFVGMSRGGEFAFTWATANPDKISCIYADNPGSNPDVFRRLGDLAMNDVPTK